jgi:hypothetical protein
MRRVSLLLPTAALLGLCWSACVVDVELGRVAPGETTAPPEPPCEGSFCGESCQREDGSIGFCSESGACIDAEPPCPPLPPDCSQAPCGAPCEVDDQFPGLCNRFSECVPGGNVFCGQEACASLPCGEPCEPPCAAEPEGCSPDGTLIAFHCNFYGECSDGPPTCQEELCGPEPCPAGLFCCNPGCGLCVPPGGDCSDQACLPGEEPCGVNGICAPDQYCCDPACGICAQIGQPCQTQGCAEPGEVCGQNVCGPDDQCCDPSCGLCWPADQPCPPNECPNVDLNCNQTDCGQDEFCCNFDLSICVPLNEDCPVPPGT